RKKKQLKKIYTFLLEKHNIAGAAAIHFTSEEEARISERFGAKTRDLIIPLGANLPETTGENDPEFQELKKQLHPNQPIILFMSRIEPKKGLDLLLPALEKLAGENIDFQFVLAGSNPQDPGYEAKIRQQIESSTLATRTLITGFVTGGVKAGLLNAADIFALPSYYENFGIAVAEAMAAGTPVVISDRVHIWPEVRGAEAGWVASCEVEAIASAIKNALSNDDERKRRGEKGREFAKNNYSWDAIATQVIEAYRHLLMDNE
ncbi:MAG: glycosyltransferase, partial [Okeania sp. SIO2H7]|nr:glycosyltransferase [Okeania sp. SIO2H7]